jgi:DtxR family transcriptional regulator, Mn-dependent transcriptional regulator
MKLTMKEEDYLETIYRLSQTVDTVGVTDVARERGVTLPTVKAVVSRLKDNGLVSQRHYGKLFLNPLGKKRAEEVYQTHKALRKFFNKVLHLPEDISEREACRMEHGMSKETLKRLTAFTEIICECPKSETGCMHRYSDAITDNKKKQQ